MYRETYCYLLQTIAIQCFIQEVNTNGSRAGMVPVKILSEWNLTEKNTLGFFSQYWKQYCEKTKTLMRKEENVTLYA